MTSKMTGPMKIGTSLQLHGEVNYVNGELDYLSIPARFRLETIHDPLPADVEIAMAGTNYAIYQLHLTVDGMETPIAKGNSYFIAERLTYRLASLLLGHMTREREKGK